MAEEVEKEGEGGVVESPPAAPRGVKEEGADGPRVRLHQLAERLTRGRSREVFAEYLQLRRSLM